MISEAMFKCYVCCIVCCTVTYGATYISTSKSVIEEGDTFEINCTVIPLTSAVRFLLNGIQRGACSAPVPGIAAGTCPLDITQDINTEETIFTIAPATTVNHTGTWECTHNAESADMTIEVFNFITVLKNNQHELPATIEASSIQNYEFKVYVACGYPQPTIIWTLHRCDGSDTGITVSSSPTLTINTTAGCTLPLVAYTSTIKASALAFPKLETCYIPKATMTYTEKLSVMPSSTFTSEVQVPGLTSQMITSLATDRVKNANSISEFSNITLPMLTGSTTLTIDISASTTSYLNTRTTSFYEHTKSANFYEHTKTRNQITEIATTSSYMNTETTNFNENIGITNFDANTKTFYSNTESNEIQTETSGIISNPMSTYQSMFATTAANDILRSFDTTTHKTTNKAKSAFETTNVTRVNSLFLTPVTTATVNSSAIKTVLSSENKEYIFRNNSRIHQIINNTESPLMSTTLFASYMLDPSFLSYQHMSEKTMTLPNNSGSSQLPSSIIDTMHHFIDSKNTLITSNLEDTSMSFDDLTGGLQNFSQINVVSSSTSSDFFSQSTDHYLSLHTIEYPATLLTSFTSGVTTSNVLSKTDNTNIRIYSTEIVTSSKYDINTSTMPSDTQFGTMNNIHGSTFDFQSTYLESYTESTDTVFSSEMSEYLLSTLKVISSFGSIYHETHVTGGNVKATNMLTYETQSSIFSLINSLHVTNQYSIQTSTVLPDFEATWLKNANHLYTKTTIKPASQQIDSGKTFIEIDTSFKDSSYSFRSFSGSRTSYNQNMTIFSPAVFQLTSTLSINTVPNGLSEKNKNIIFISTTAAVVTIIFVVALIILGKIYMSKDYVNPRKEDDNISWSNNMSHLTTALPEYSFNGENIYPLLNTSPTSFTMHPYEHNWNDTI